MSERLCLYTCNNKYNQQCDKNLFSPVEQSQNCSASWCPCLQALAACPCWLMSASNLHRSSYKMQSSPGTVCARLQHVQGEDPAASRWGIYSHLACWDFVSIHRRAVGTANTDLFSAWCLQCEGPKRSTVSWSCFHQQRVNLKRQNVVSILIHISYLYLAYLSKGDHVTT